MDHSQGHSRFTTCKTCDSVVELPPRIEDQIFRRVRCKFGHEQFAAPEMYPSVLEPLRLTGKRGLSFPWWN